MMKCLSKDCDYMFTYKPGHDDFTCKKCLKRYCLQCETVYHFGMTCIEFEVQKDIKHFSFVSKAQLQQEEEDLGEGHEFTHYVQSGLVRECPQCDKWVERSKESNRMVCRCSYQFCYTCNEEWPLKKNGGGRPDGQCSCMCEQ